MATGKEGLYVVSRGEGKSAVTVAEVAQYVGANVPAATTTVRGSVFRTGSLPNVTDSSAGTSGGATIAAVPLTTAAATGADTATLPTKTSTDASVTALRNAVATLAAQINGMKTELRNAGIIT
jgi:hypothetical protein